MLALLSPSFPIQEGFEDYLNLYSPGHSFSNLPISFKSAVCKCLSFLPSHRSFDFFILLFILLNFIFFAKSRDFAKLCIFDLDVFGCYFIFDT